MIIKNSSYFNLIFCILKLKSNKHSCFVFQCLFLNRKSNDQKIHGPLVFPRIKIDRKVNQYATIHRNYSTLQSLKLFICVNCAIVWTAAHYSTHLPLNYFHIQHVYSCLLLFSFVVQYELFFSSAAIWRLDV